MKRTGIARRFLIGAFVAAAMSAPAMSTSARAQDFFAGKTIRLIAAFPPGASIDRTTRIIAEYLPKYIPGKPLVIVENMAGAGGVVAANNIFNVAPKDGTAIGVFNTQLPAQELIGQQGVSYKAAQYNWVGALASTRVVCYVRGDTDIHSMDDLLKPRATPIRYAAAGVGNHQTTIGNFLNLIGAKIRIISGYPSIQQIYLALEQGEVQATCSPWEGVRVTSKAHIDSGLLRVFVQDGETKAPDLPKAQLMIDVLKDPGHKELWAALTRPEAAGRAMALPPGVPSDRVQLIRRAYDAVMKDPEFIAAIAKTGDALDPSTGEQVQDLVGGIMKSSPEVVANLKAMYEVKK